MAKIDRELLRKLVQNSGKSARKISLDAGLGATAVKDILSGRSRAPGAATMTAIAQQLGVPVETFFDAAATADGDARDVMLVPRFLSVRYRVKAGLWEEVGTAEPIDQYDYAVAPNPRFADWSQWLELVVGDSVNKLIPDKHLAHVVDTQDMGYAPQQDDVVVVERSRDGGGTRERTIKQVEIKPDGAVELWPRSTNPMWQSPVILTDGARDGEDIEVMVVGLVIGSYNPTLLKPR